MSEVTHPEASSSFLKSKYRTHTCAELRRNNAGNTVSLSGWIQRKRDHGGVVFVDLRDHYGVTQVVFSSEQAEQIQHLKSESVVHIKGEVKERTKELINPKHATGEIEVHATHLEILSSCEAIPFQVAEDDNAPETTRLKFRFLELRREKLHRNIMMRNKVVRAVREIMHDLGFNEFHTPILTSSSPEGARDFIVPSRLHPGKFYALPQAPQQFKQLLMIAGFDRYFQIAPCFRDEDARADRSPGEFYQIDMELSFVEQDDVLRVNEELMYRLFSRCSEWQVTKPPFPRIAYKQAMADFGSDKPDLRIPFRLKEVTEVFEASGFRVFKETIVQGGGIVAIPCDVSAIPSRKYFDDLQEWFSKQDKGEPALGLAYLAFEGDSVKGSIQKFVSPTEISELKKALSIGEKAVVFLAAGNRERILPALGKLRNKLGFDFDRIEKKAWRFCWVTDFPFYEKGEEPGQVNFFHNPFSMPQGGLEALMTKDPLTIPAYQYDFVCNGYELASGGIRNHTPEIMYKAFEIAGYNRETVDNKFGGMIRSFTYGAPPHGGIAHGVDRIVMLLCEEEAIREVIPFPLAQNGEDLLMGAPSDVSEKQLREVHIQLRPPPK